MAETATAVPTGVYPYLSVKGGKAAIDFYTRAFGAEEKLRMMAEDGERILHAQLRINGALVMISDDFPEYRGGGEAPAPAGVTIHLEVDDADAWWARAVKAGASIVMPIADQFWGDRFGQVKDPFGHDWSIGAPIKR